jgi:hypothetical protein
VTAFDPKNPKLIPYRELEPFIENGWLAQYRGREFLSRWIQAASVGCHSHSGMLRTIDGNGHRVDLLDITENRNGAAVPFEDEVRRYSGLIDVFRPDLDRWPEFNQRGAVNYMRILTGRKYGWRGVIRMYFLRFPVVRSFLHTSTDDLLDADKAPFCSHAVCSAYRVGGGIDPVPRRPDDLVTPNDLTCSMFFEYVGTPTASL